MSSTNVHRYRLGEARVTVLNDGQREANVQGFVTNADEASVKAELQQAGLPADKITIGFAPVLIEQNGKRILIDVGNGQQAFQESKGQVGRLLESLSAAGLSREEINVVVCSHFHADHVSGLLMADGSKTFPIAEVCVPEPEWRFWMSDAEMAKAPEGRMKGLFQNNRRVFDGLERKVRTFAWDTEVVPGLKAVGTPGHSIGHTSFHLTSGTEQLFIQVDICSHAVIFAHRPEWHGWFDQDAAQAARTRMDTYRMLAAKRILVQAFHFPWPGHGFIVERDGGFAFVPSKD